MNVTATANAKAAHSVLAAALLAALTIALGVGATVGTHALVTPLLAARARPWDGFELGVGAAFPQSLDGDRVNPYPVVNLKLAAPGGEQP